jgi:hypothetical protein
MSNTSAKPVTLDDWLLEVTVTGPLNIDANSEKFRAWFIVQDYDGKVIGAFPTYAAAYRFRLDHINRNLNPE